MRAKISLHGPGNARVEERQHEGTKWVNLIINDALRDGLEFEITLFEYTKERLLAELNRE